MDVFSSFSLGSMSTQSHLLATLSEVVILLPVFLIIFSWRGFFQALAAKLMGDTTPEEDGFLTLNPLAHVDVAGLFTILGVFFVIAAFFSSAIPRTLLLLMLVMLGVRWTYPVHIDESQFKNYRLGGVVTTLAGPLGNFLLAFICVGLLKAALHVSLAQYALVTLVEILKTLIRIAIFFGVIDLIPLPPFDGGKLLRYLLPYNRQHMLHWLEEHSLMIMLVLFFVPGISTAFFNVLFFLSAIIKALFFSVFF